VLAGIAVATVALYSLAKLAFLHTLRLQNISVISSTAKESSSFIESIRGIMPLKAFGQESNRQRIWQNLKADAVNAQAKLTRTTAIFDAITSSLLAFEGIVVTYLAVLFTMKGSMSIGMIFGYMAYKKQFLDSAARLVEQIANFRLLDVHLGRIADIALTEPVVRPPSGFLEPIRGKIALRNVCFSYGAGEPEALKNVSFDINPGELVALRGPSGGGKSTLLKVMVGLLEPGYGQVFVDDLPLASLDRRFWNNRIGVVLQDDSLHAGTLAENIAFFDPEIDMARVRWAAEIAGIADDISRMPMHYETLVGDMGSALSGGQRQRMFLARALYPQPAILFMDEGTSNLEIALEERIVAAIAGLGITRIVSAHRTAAIDAADRILDVVSGQVTEIPAGREEQAA
jgi:ATP-binding cassette subfamily B protein RaxB